MRTRPARKTAPSRSPAVPPWDLSLYVVNHTPLSLLAVENVKQICQEHLAGHYRLKVIDVAKSPQRARTDNVVATPALVRRQREPGRKLVGSMANAGRVMAWLGLRPGVDLVGRSIKSSKP